MNLPFDLTKTVFIATANDLTEIPGPLRDRMVNSKVLVLGNNQDTKLYALGKNLHSQITFNIKAASDAWFKG